MQHLNYCRQMVKQFSATTNVPNIPGETRKTLGHMIDLAGASQKFILPDGGQLFADLELRGIDEDAELRLPYPFVALEYPVSARPGAGLARSSKRIIFARQRDDGFIVCSVALWADHQGCWGATTALDFAIPTTKFIDRISGRARLAIRALPQVLADVQQEVDSLFSFLNALGCSNVRIERSELGKTRKAMTKKGSLPFDEYHVLTIATTAKTGDSSLRGCTRDSQRQPREHLRRGHIRRYEGGMKIWVNATVVNAGVGGKVHKDYRLAA